MNELQIRLSADISALTSALNKAKATIKSFESETEKESEKGNVGFKRKIGLIESLTNKMKSLRLVQTQAFNESQIEKYNQELQQTEKELARLNALGRTVTANLSGVGGGFNQVARQGGNAVGVTQEFNRVIQDAPFGLIGIGNNLQQLASNFSVLKTQAGSTGKAVGLAVTSIISPINLGLLAVSALTAAFTAYQMGAFDFVTATDEAKTAQDEFNESLKDTEQTLKEGFFNELLKAQGLLKTENLGGRLVDVPAFQTAQEVLEKLGSTIDGLNKNELEALESFLSQRLADAARASANATTELEKSLAATDVTGYQEVLTKVNEQLKFYDEDTKKSTKSTKELKEEINSFSTDPLVDAYFKAIQAGAAFRKSIDEAAGDVSLEDPTLNTQNQITASLVQSGPPIKEFAEEYKGEADKIKEINQLVGDSFGALGTAIAANLDISNDSVKGFVSTVLSNAPKLIQAIIAQAQASNKAADIANAGNVKQATGNAIVTATSAAKGLGPIGLAALPILIGGALALVSSAFGKSGSSGGGGAVASSGAPPQIFTNAQTVTPPSASSPNYNPGSDIDWDKAQGRLTVDVGFDSLQFGLDMYRERKQSGG